MKTPRAVIYIRVSTSHQEEHGTSLTGQLEACLRKAKELGAEVVKVAEEVKSGGLYLTRGELQKALALIEAGDADTLILARLDRTGREVDSLRDIRRRIEIMGGHLVFADGMTFEKNAVGNLMFTQLSAFAEFERAIIRERMVAGLESKARAGLMPSRSKAPYGYHIWKRDDLIRGDCSANEVGRYVLAEDQARWIAPIFERIGEGVSLRSVCAWLSQSGACSSSGQPWNPASLRNIIGNPVYKGTPAWRKTRRVVDESRAARGLGIEREDRRPESERIYMEAPALVSAALWESANQRLRTGREERSGRADRRYLLTGLLRCPLCGARLYSRLGVSRRGDKIYRNHTYKCAGTTKRQLESAAPCDLPVMGGATMERFVTEALTELLINPQLMEDAQRDFAAVQKKQSATRDDAGQIKRLKREIEALRKREDEATGAEIEARLQGNDGGAFARFRAKAEASRLALESQLATIETAAQSAEVGSGAMPTGEDGAIYADKLTDGGVPVAKRAALLRGLVECIYPVALSDELRISARQMRGAGREEPEEGSARAQRFCGGCEIVLRTGPGATYILRRRVVRLEPGRDTNKRAALRPVIETDLRIETASAFPVKKGRRSPLDEV